MEVYLLHAHYEHIDGYDYYVNVYADKAVAQVRVQELIDEYIKEFDITREQCVIEQGDNIVFVYPQGEDSLYSAEFWIEKHDVL